MSFMSVNGNINREKIAVIAMGLSLGGGYDKSA